MGPANRSIQRLVPAAGGGGGTDSRGASPAAGSQGPAGRPLASLAPRGVGAILDAAFEVLRARFGACMLLAVPVSIPVQILQRFVPAQFEGMDSVALLGVQLMLAFTVQSLVVGLVCQLVYDELQGRELRLGHALRHVLRRAPALLLLTAATATLTGLGMVCCLLPGFAAVWLLMVAPAALVLEDLGPLAALARSWRLMSRSFLRWLGIFFTQTLVLLPVTLTVAGLGEPATSELVEQYLGWPSGVYETLVVALSSTLSALAMVFTAVVMTVFYLDSRVRFEGFDLHMRFERLLERTPR